MDTVRTLSLTAVGPDQYSYALAAPDGTISVGRMGALHLGQPFPVDLRPVLSEIPQTDFPLHVVLVIEDGDEAEVIAESLAFEYAGSIQVAGVAVVSQTEVLEAIGMAVDGASITDDSAIVTRINELCEGDLRPDQATEAWAIGLLCAGVGKEPRTSLLLNLLANPPAGARVRKDLEKCAPRGVQGRLSAARPNPHDQTLGATRPATKASRSGPRRPASSSEGASTLVCIRDAAHALGVSVSTVRRLVRDRELAVTRIGRQLRIRSEEVAALVTRNETTTVHREAVQRRAKVVALRDPDAPDDADRELARRLGLL